ncbi:hypothetical protein RDABS01_037870 [Bienertia sinuspersici]
MSKITLSDLQNPLYLHPSDGPTIVAVEKLKGSAGYKAWKRSMEISLASKRKLGFGTGMEELDNMRDVPAVIELTPVINAFVKALETERDEQKLFQFLNGLDEIYGLQRSQDVLEGVKEESDSSAMYGNGNGEGCNVCGKKNHTADKCWRVIGFPKDHPRMRRPQKGRKKETYQGGKWNLVKGEATNKMAANTSQMQGDTNGITMQQLEQMLNNQATKGGQRSNQGETAINPSPEPTKDHEKLIELEDEIQQEEESEAEMSTEPCGHSETRQFFEIELANSEKEAETRLESTCEESNMTGGKILRSTRTHKTPRWLEDYQTQKREEHRRT